MLLCAPSANASGRLFRIFLHFILLSYGAQCSAMPRRCIIIYSLLDYSIYGLKRGRAAWLSIQEFFGRSGQAKGRAVWWTMGQSKALIITNPGDEDDERLTRYTFSPTSKEWWCYGDVMIMMSYWEFRSTFVSRRPCCVCFIAPRPTITLRSGTAAWKSKTRTVSPHCKLVCMVQEA